MKPRSIHTRLVVRRRERRRDGAVMLVVLLILMMATAAAMLALNTVNSEMQATGQERIALQTRNIADAAMVTTLAWVNLVEPSDLRRIIETPAAPPMGNYPEPSIDYTKTQGFAGRITMASERHLQPDPSNASNEVGIVCDPGAGGSGGSGAGGAGGGSGGGVANTDGCHSSFDTANRVGSFGPNQAYALPASAGGYVVDLTDCVRAPAALAPGSPSGGPNPPFAYVCTVTARGRLEIGGPNRTWNYGSVQGYTQRVFASAHDARAMVVTPEMLGP